jgi:hypothetical protein
MLLRESSEAIGEDYNEASVMGGQSQHRVTAGDELIAFGEALTLGFNGHSPRRKYETGHGAGEGSIGNQRLRWRKKYVALGECADSKQIRDFIEGEDNGIDQGKSASVAKPTS